MGNGFQFLDIILFAMVAAFLVLRLRGVLGKKTGHQRQRPDPMVRRAPKEDAVAELPGRGASPDAEFDDATAADPDEEQPDDPLSQGFRSIRALDRSFHPDGFLEGATGAFEMIVGAFAEGDAGKLRALLSDDVFESFTDAIERRGAAGETVETTIVAVKSAAIEAAGTGGSNAYVTVCFVSEQVNVTRDSENRIVDGDPNRVNEITDVWTFVRNTRSSDPNWKLVETRSDD